MRSLLMGLRSDVADCREESSFSFHLPTPSDVQHKSCKPHDEPKVDLGLQTHDKSFLTFFLFSVRLSDLPNIWIP